MVSLRLLQSVALVMVFAGCEAKDDPEESGTPVDTGEHIEHTPAERCTPELRVDGTPADTLADPSVGDAWYLLMYCDDVLQVGSYTLRVEPPELATIDAEAPIVTFAASGTGEVQYRMGAHQVALSVVVGD